MSLKGGRRSGVLAGSVVLRAVVVTLLLAQSGYWAAAMAFGLHYATPGDGGLQWLAGIFATPPFVVFTLPGMWLAVRKRWRWALASALAGIVTVPLIVWLDLAETAGRWSTNGSLSGQGHRVGARANQSPLQSGVLASPG